jgi:hypothetical protein
VGRLLGACSPPLAARRDSGGHDPAVRPGVGPLGVRTHPRPRHPTPDPHARDPVASGDMATPPARRNFSTHPKQERMRVLGSVGRLRLEAAPTETSVVWVGGIPSAGATGGRSLRSPRALRVRIGAGRRWPRPRVCSEGGEQRGTRRRGALRGRGRGACRRRARGRPSLQMDTAAPAKQCHAVEQASASA